MACVIGNAGERRGKGDACALAQSALCSMQLFVEAGRASEAVGICGGAAACQGAINCRLSSVNIDKYSGPEALGCRGNMKP